MIYILKGPIRSGKTSALVAWSQGRKDVEGLLSPDDTSGVRYFYELGEGRAFDFEVSPSTSAPTINIGPFCFLRSAFERANRYLLQAAKRQKISYIVLDELGKLELRGEGLHEAARMLIPQFQELARRHLILVVRDTLVEATIKHYNIGPYGLLDKEELHKLKN